MIFPIHTSNPSPRRGRSCGSCTAWPPRSGSPSLTVVSYSFFGFIFGNHAIRFFIAWTYIMALPFAFFQFPADWLDIRDLYLVSIRFVLVLSAGAVYCSRLIAHRGWRRLVPFVVPVLFVILGRFIALRLDDQCAARRRSPTLASQREEIVRRYPWITIDGDKAAVQAGYAVRLVRRASGARRTARSRSRIAISRFPIRTLKTMRPRERASAREPSPSVRWGR